MRFSRPVSSGARCRAGQTSRRHAPGVADDGYELIDAGDGRRLERFGDRVVDRPALTATEPKRGTRALWEAADLRFEPAGGWLGDVRGSWQIELDGIRLELGAGSGGQVGVFPEHATFWPWLRDVLEERPTASVLNLFASTGATTLACAGAGAAVTHVDASRAAVTWARRNADLTGLADRPIRWIVDDAVAFSRREARRGQRYDGFVLDPPSYGHGPGGRAWTIDRDLVELLDAIRDVSTDDAFVLLTAHATGVRPRDLDAVLRDVFGPSQDIAAEPIELRALSGAVLPLGASARMIRR